METNVLRTDKLTDMANSSSSLTIRPNLLRQRVNFIIVPLLGAIAAVAAANPHQLVAAIIAIAVIIGLMVVAMAKVRITVTPDEVVVADTFGPGRGGRVPRSAVVSIHSYSYRVDFEGPNGRSVVNGPAYWTTRQLREVSELLGVPLINHRRFGGSGRVSQRTE